LQLSSTIEVLIWLVLLAPLASFGLCLILPGRYSLLAKIFAPAFLLISASVSLYLFYSITSDTPLIIQLEWFRVVQHTFNFSIEVNQLSLLMMPLVTVISFLIHIYSVGYMAKDNGIKRYFAMLGFFTFSMLGIVLANDLLIIFSFWELVGFSSYMLIGHWMEQPAAAKAAQKAFIFNRVGDAGFLIGIMIIWANTKSLNLTELLHLPELYSWQTAASLCIFCGVIGKSAQLPLFTWLPDAMEGPTPVSALIHAATMVVAGVFLLARVFPLFTPTALNVVAVIGCVTALVAALCALNQIDIKKILAYSTISQLGLMVTAVGAGSTSSAMLHLFTHAFFKAGLFLAAGSVIHALHNANVDFDVKDIRNLGGLRKKLPFTFFCFLICGASLSGIPFFSGFISKDSILASIWFWSGSTFSWKWIILILVFTISFITVLYTFRMIWFIFLGKENKPEVSVTESGWIMRVPMIILALSSFWLFISIHPFLGSGWFTSLMGDLPHSNLITILSTGLIALVLAISWFIYVRKRVALQSLQLFQNGFNIDLLYQKIIGQSALKLAIVSDSFDRKWIDGFIHFTVYVQVSVAHVVAWFDKYLVDGSVNGLARLAGAIGSITRSFQGGKIQLYIFWSVIGMIIFLFFALI